MGSEIWKEPI